MYEFWIHVLMSFIVNNIVIHVYMVQTHNIWVIIIGVQIFFEVC